MASVKNHQYMTIADKNGNEFYVIPAREFQSSQLSRQGSILAVIGAIAITLFFVTFLAKTARKLFV